MPHGSALKARIQIMRHDLNSIGGLFIIILIGKGPKMGVCYRGMLLKPLRLLKLPTVGPMFVGGKACCLRRWGMKVNCLIHKVSLQVLIPQIFIFLFLCMSFRHRRQDVCLLQFIPC